MLVIQLLEPVGKLIRVQREPPFHLVRRCFVTCAAAEAQTAPHKHSLRTVFIQRDHNIVVEYLFLFSRPRLLTRTAARIKRFTRRTDCIFVALPQTEFAQSGQPHRHIFAPKLHSAVFHPLCG